MRRVRHEIEAAEGIAVGAGKAGISDAGCVEQWGAYQRAFREGCHAVEKGVRSMLGGTVTDESVVFRPTSGVFLIRLPEYHGAAIYEIPLGDDPSAADVCRWLGHISEKRWATPHRIAALVKAIDCVYGLKGLP